MQTVAETPTFSRQADKLFNEDERRDLIDYLAEHPLAGDEIPGTGGVRKVRFGASGRGKRGGVRVIYFFGGEGVPIYALLAYSKVRQDRFEPRRAPSGGRSRGGHQVSREAKEMSTFGEDLIQSLNEALDHAKGDGPAIVHTPISPREVRMEAKLTQTQMAALMGMSLSGYRKWEQGRRQVSGPAATLLRVIAREPEAVKRALHGSGHT